MITSSRIPGLPVQTDTRVGKRRVLSTVLFAEIPRTEGGYSGPYVDSDKFIWKQPLSLGDGRNGQICTASRAWFPAHMVVWVDGLPYGQPFAPKPAQPPIRLNPPFTALDPED